MSDNDRHQNQAHTRPREVQSPTCEALSPCHSPAQEIAYLRSQPIARFTSVSADGQPDVIPVRFEFDGTFFWIGGSGPTVVDTRKFRNVRAGNHKGCPVIDDMVSFDPFIARGIRIYGDAEQPFKRVGMVGPGTYMSITPTRLLELEHGRRTRR